jgi:hypothetical protein
MIREWRERDIEGWSTLADGEPVTSEGAVPRSGRLQFVSPELVLVDPVLAEHARAHLADPADTLLRIERLIRADRRPVPGVEGATLDDIETLSRSVDSQWGTDPPGRKAHGRSLVLAGVAAVAVLIASLLAGVRIDLRGDPAGADATVRQPPTARSREAPTVAAATQAAPRRTSREKSPSLRKDDHPARTSGSRRFAWAPVPGASGYHVELFRGRSLVFSVDTTGAQVSIPRQWRLSGRRMTLRSGQYRWYVWALRSGVRASSAVVQARLVVPRR